jgi:hypothetical protein
MTKSKRPVTKKPAASDRESFRGFVRRLGIRKKIKRKRDLCFPRCLLRRKPRLPNIIVVTRGILSDRALKFGVEAQLFGVSYR